MAKGFTLIELVIVIVLITIVGSLGIGLLSGTGAYDARLAADQWLASLRLSQKLALLRQDADNLFTVTVTQSSNEWLLLSSHGSTSVNNINISRDRITLHASNSDFSSSCTVLPVAAFPMVFYFNGYGDQVDVSRVQLTQNQRLCFVAGQTKELCISPSGYAYNGSCKP